MDELKPVIVNGEGRNDSPTTRNLLAENEPKGKTQQSKFSGYLQAQSSENLPSPRGRGLSDDNSSLSTAPYNQLEVHRRSDEIGRVIITGPQPKSEPEARTQAPTSLDQMNLLTKFFDDHEQLDVSLVDIIKATMIGNVVTPDIAKGAPHFSGDLVEAQPFSKPAMDADSSLRNFNENSRAGALTLGLARYENASDFLIDSADSMDLKNSQTRDTSNVQHSANPEQKFLKQLENLQASEKASAEGEVGSGNLGQKSSDGTSMSQRENADQNSRGSAGQEQHGDEYDNWRSRLAELVEEKISIAVQEGLWAVKLNLKSVGIDGIDVQLSSSDNSLSGKIYTPDPVTRDLLVESLQKLERELAQSLSIQGYDEIHLEVIESPNGLPPVAMEGSKEIQVAASELLSSLSKRPKSDDGFDVFV